MIISSAVASSDCGMVRSRAFAILRVPRSHLARQRNSARTGPDHRNAITLPLGISGSATQRTTSKGVMKVTRDPPQPEYHTHPRQGDSLKRSGMDHSDSYATAKERLRSAARPLRVSLARCISDSALLGFWFCLALPDPFLGRRCANHLKQHVCISDNGYNDGE